MKKLFFLIAFATVFALVAMPVKAEEPLSAPTPVSSLLTRIQEKIEYFFAFKVEKKVEVLEKQADRKLESMQSNLENGDNTQVTNLLQNYLQIKNRQNDLLDDVEGEVMGRVQERTLGQQMIMEGMKGNVDEGIKQEMIQVQEQVVNQVGQRVIDVDGPEGRNEFFQKVEHVWAPGTGPGGEAGTTFAPGTGPGGEAGTTFAPGTGAGGQGGTTFAPGTSAGGNGGVVIEGGSIQFAPGTSAGGNSGSDIKSVEVVGN